MALQNPPFPIGSRRVLGQARERGFPAAAGRAWRVHACTGMHSPFPAQDPRKITRFATRSGPDLAGFPGIAGNLKRSGPDLSGFPGIAGNLKRSGPDLFRFARRHGDSHARQGVRRYLHFTKENKGNLNRSGAPSGRCPAAAGSRCLWENPCSQHHFPT